MSSSGSADLVSLLARLDADYSSLEKQMKKANTIFAQQCQAIETRQSSLIKRLSDSSSFKGITTALTAALSVAAVREFVTNISDATEGIEKQSKALGISTDTYQEWSLSARHAGIDQDTLNSSLDFFSKNLGMAQLKVTPFGTLLKKLGVDIHAGPEQAFYQFVDAVNQVNNVAQKNAVITTGMGRGAVQMAAWLGQGTDAIKAQSAEFLANGEVIGKEQIDKIHSLSVAWEDLKTKLTVAGANVLAGVDESLDNIVANMGSDSFQSSLKNFGKTMGEVAAFFLQISGSSYFKYLVAAAGGALVGGPIGAAIGVGGVFGASMKNQPQADPVIQAYQTRQTELQGQIDSADRTNQTVPDAVYKELALVTKAIADGKASLAAEAAAVSAPGAPAAAGKKGAGIDLSGILDADKMSKLAEERKAMLDKIGVDQATADAALVSEQDKLAVQLLTGQVGYYDAVKKMIADDLAAKIATINAEEKKELDSLDKLKLGQADYAAYKARIEATAATKIKTAQASAAAQTDQTGSSGLLRQSGIDETKQIQSYKDQISTLGLIEGALAAATFEQQQYNLAREKGLVDAQGNLTLTPEEIAAIKAKAAAIGQAAQAEADAATISRQSIQVQDDLRSGLEDIGAAGIKGFKSMKEAAYQFMEQLAELILKLYVMKPLVEGLLGPAGGAGGGLFGDGINSFFNSAGSVTSDTAATLLTAAGTGLSAAATALMTAASALASAGGVNIGSGSGLAGIFGSGSDGTGITGDLGLGGDGGGWLGYAKGGIHVPGKGSRALRRFAKGGVSSRPAIFGDGSGAEAAVPLPDGRRIPVALSIPSMAKLRGMSRDVTVTAPVYVTQSLAGAIDAAGVSRIAQGQAVTMGVEVAKQMKKQMPALIAQAFQDKL